MTLNTRIESGSSFLTLNRISPFFSYTLHNAKKQMSCNLMFSNDNGIDSVFDSLNNYLTISFVFVA